MTYDQYKNETQPLKPIHCDYCGCEIPEYLVCTVPTGEMWYNFNYACPDCAAVEIEKYNSVEIEFDE